MTAKTAFELIKQDYDSMSDMVNDVEAREMAVTLHNSYAARLELQKQLFAASLMAFTVKDGEGAKLFADAMCHLSKINMAIRASGGNKNS
jgi:hypothetical protein